jgi:hypothetical protein
MWWARKATLALRSFSDGLCVPIFFIPSVVPYLLRSTVTYKVSGVTRNERARGKNCVMVPPEEMETSRIFGNNYVEIHADCSTAVTALLDLMTLQQL